MKFWSQYELTSRNSDYQIIKISKSPILRIQAANQSPTHSACTFRIRFPSTPLLYKNKDLSFSLPSHNPSISKQTSTSQPPKTSKHTRQDGTN